MAARRVAVPDVSTLVVTTTLAGLFAEGVWAGGTASRGVAVLRAFAVVAMLCGAVTGGFVLKAGVAWATAIPATLSLVVAIVILWRLRARRPQPGWSGEAPAAEIA